MEKKAFPLGFWNYARLNGIGPDPVRDWVEEELNRREAENGNPGSAAVSPRLPCNTGGDVV